MILHIMNLVYEVVYRLSQNRLAKVSGCHIDRKIAGSQFLLEELSAIYFIRNKC